MKRKLLLAALCVVGALGFKANAQTDVTSTYITNASFESCTAFGTGNAAAAAGEGGTDYASAEWTLSQKSGWSNSAVFEYGSGGQINGTAVPAKDPYGNAGKGLAFSQGWGGTNLYKSSTVTLPAGTYTLVAPTYNVFTVFQMTSKLGFVSTSGAISHISTRNSFPSNMWTMDKVEFTLTEATEGYFQVGFTAVSGGSTSNAKLVVDGLLLYDGTYDATLAYNTTIATGAAVNNPIEVPYVVNGNFDIGNTSGWNTTTGLTNKIASNKSGAITGNFCENWKNSPYTGKISQTLSSIPNGVYKLTAASFFNQANTYADHVKVFANDDAEFVTAETTPALYTVFTKVTANSLEIGVNKVSSAGESGDNWIGIDNVSLVYYGADATVAEVKLASFVAAYNEALDRAKAFTESSMFASAWSTLQSAISTNTLDLDDAGLTEENLTTATTNLNAASDAATAAVAQKSVYDTAVSTIGGGTNVDLTSLLTNPSFETNNLSGWTNTNAETQTNKSFDNVQGDIYAQRWHFAGTVDINQTIAALPAGFYQVSAYSYFSETGARVYANSTEVAVTTSGKYSVVVEVSDKGSINLGAGCASTSSSWWCVDDFALTYLTSNAAELPYTLATGKMGTDKSAAQSTAETTFLASKTAANYNALLAAIAAAEASKANYTALKAAIDKAADVLEKNNFVTAAATTAFSDEIETATAAWTDVTYTDAEATAEISVLGSAVSGWHAIADEGKAGAFLTSAWGKTDANWWDGFYINTWSTEGDTDGSGFSVPFFEYYTDADKNLAAKTMTATLTGLDNGRYEVELWARVQRRSDADFNGDNSMITMNVNGGTPVSIMSNTSNNVGTGGNVMRLGRYTAVGDVTDGTLTLTIDVKLGANVHWLTWRDVKYTKLDEASMAVNAEAKYGTFVAPFDVTIPSGVSAYTVDAVEGTTLTMNKVTTTIPANTPVVLYAEDGYEATTQYGKAVEGTPTEGLLTGVYTATAAPNGSYVLQNNDGKVGFYQVDTYLATPTVGANRAYLTMGGGSAKAFFFGDEATAIAGVEAAEAEDDAPAFNLAGQPVTKDFKGIVIKNGKKFLQK